MRKILKTFLLMAALSAISAAPVFAEAVEATRAKGGGNTFITIVVISVVSGMVIAAVGVGWAQCHTIKTAVEGIARNPGASGKILPTMLIGLAMMESLAIYVLVIALILLFTNPFLSYIG